LRHILARKPRRTVVAILASGSAWSCRPAWSGVAAFAPVAFRPEVAALAYGSAFAGFAAFAHRSGLASIALFATLPAFAHVTAFALMPGDG
jgi:hypothetical protein